MSTANYLVGGAVCAALALMAFWGMWLGWRRRQKLGEEISAVLQPVKGEKIAEYAKVFYVLTHKTENPLERVALKGLSYRGWAKICVHTDGVQIAVSGEKPAALTQISAVTTGRNSIAKAVEKDGLTLVHWQLAEKRLSSVLRFADPLEQKEFMKNVTKIYSAKKESVC